MFTLTHLGPSLFLGALGFRFFNLWALLLGSVLMDGENIYLLLANIMEGCPKCSHHGLFHSILGAIIGSFILAFFLFEVKKLLLKISLKQSFSFSVLFFSSLIGWLSHILADAIVHKDVFLFWPLENTPFLISWNLYWPISYWFAGMGIISAIILIIRLKHQKTL